MYYFKEVKVCRKQFNARQSQQLNINVIEQYIFFQIRKVGQREVIKKHE